MQTFLSVGFSPSAALVTWQLEQSGAFQTFTYWPTHTIDFNTELFGNQRFHPNQLDISSSNESQVFDFILLCIPTLKDVNRMVKKIEKVVSKSTVVLVNLSEGTSVIQRLVKAQLPRASVAGFICDYPVRHIPDTSTNIWQIIQWGNSKSPGPQMACHVEPVALKSLASFESALTSRKMPCSHPKNNAAFLAVQWERTIFTVGFELMTIIFGVASVEKVIKEQIARPIINGVVNELLMLANASGAKSLPSCSHFVQQAPFLTRKAPSIFAIPHASRLYYEFYNRAHISLDLAVLCPIMLADELKKARTPYLDCIYAFSSQLQKLNSAPSDLFARVDLEARQRLLDRDYEKQHGNSNVSRMEQQLQHALLQAEEREAKSKEIEAASIAREEKLSVTQKSVEIRQKELQEAERSVSQLKAREEQLQRREALLAERHRNLDMREQEFDRFRSMQGQNQQNAPLSRSQSASKLPTMPHMPPQMPQHPPQTPRQLQNGQPREYQQQQQPPLPMPFTSPQQRTKQNRQQVNQMLDNHAPLTGRQSQMPIPRRASQLAMAHSDHVGMMSSTQSKNHRQSMRNASTRAASMASMSGMNGTHSQAFQLDGIIGLASQDRYSFAGPKRGNNGLSADHTLGANRPYSHGFSNAGMAAAHNMYDQRNNTHAKSISTSKADLDFSNFGYSYDSRTPNAGSQGSESLSGNSRCSPPASPSATPPTPNTLDAPDVKAYSIPRI